LSEGLKHHIDNNKPLTEHLYRAGSSAYFNLIAEARSLYSRGNLEFTNEDDLGLLTETDLGHFGMFEGKKVPLDFPIELNEQMDIYDDIANMEFGMDYDQLGSNEKEWVRDEIDNMEMRESLNEDIYDKFLDNPSSPKGRAKSLILKFTKEYGDDASSMAVDRFASKNNLKPEEKYILKYITKNDIKISSQPGGPDFSALKEANNLLKQDALSPAEYQKAKKLKGFDPKNYKWDKNQDLHLIRKMNESALNEIDEEDEYEIASRNLFDMTWDEVRRQNNQSMVQDVHDEVSKDDEEDWDDDDNFYTLKESINEYDVYMPSQEEVDKFFALTQNETHYLNSKPVMGQEKTFNKMEVEPWDEYDYSNWNSLVRKAKQQGKLDESASTEEKRIAMRAIKSIAKYRGVSEDEAKRDLTRAIEQLGSLKEAIKDIKETIELGKNLQEKLCKKGEAYRKRRMAAGEKSSAYLSGRAVKVCNGTMSGKKKKK